MRTPEERKEIAESVREAFGTTLEQHREISNRIVSGQRETMRNLALASGGLATGALVILGSNIVPIVCSYVILGVVILLIEVVLSFGYLFHKQKLEVLNWGSGWKSSLAPTAKILDLYDDLMEKKITPEYFDEESKIIARKYREHSKEERNRLVEDVPKTDYWDMVFVGLLALGTIFVILGLILPHF